MSAVYADSSALLKLVRAEPESRALQALLTRKARSHPHSRLLSSTLALTEVMRVARRWAPEAAARASDVLQAVTLIPLDYPLLRYAGLLDPPGLRSLDAIHLATALSLESEVEAVVTYDHRFVAACQLVGIRVESPA